jgi:Glycosyltransferase family 87
VELRDRALAQLALPLLLAVVLLTAAAPALAAELTTPASETAAPKFFTRSAQQVKAIAARAEKVREERREGPMQPAAYTKGYGRWQVSYFRDGDEVAQVQLDDATGAIVEQWNGSQVAWSMARGYEGAFGRKLNAPYVWIPLCLLFLAPFVDWRRPLRLLHLDLLVLVAFGASHVFFNRGEIGVSVPLVYPVMLYLLLRVLLAGFRPRAGRGPLLPHVPVAWLLIGIVFLAAFRIGLNVTDSNVIDVGYAGVIGADRIVDGDPLYGPGFAKDVERGDTYGPLTYLLYVPFEQALPWSGSWDDLPAARGAAIAFDLLTLGGLFLLGRRLRPGRDGLVLGTALAWAWVAYPYTAFALETNSNDTLVALFCVLALLALTVRRQALGGVARGAAIAAGTAAKFAPVALAPLFLRGVSPAAGDRAPSWRGPLAFVVAFAVVLAVLVLPFLPDAGPRELYDRTIGYQAGRPSPFSVWGQVDGLGWLQSALKVAVIGLGLLLAFVPRRRDARQVAALGAAVLIVLELTMTHWFYLYVVWFVPFVLLAVLGAYGARRREDESPPPTATLVHEPAEPLAQA